MGRWRGGTSSPPPGALVPEKKWPKNSSTSKTAIFRPTSAGALRDLPSLRPFYIVWLPRTALGLGRSDRTRYGRFLAQGVRGSGFILRRIGSQLFRLFTLRTSHLRVVQGPFKPRAVGQWCLRGVFYWVLIQKLKSATARLRLPGRTSNTAMSVSPLMRLLTTNRGSSWRPFSSLSLIESGSSSTSNRRA